MAGIFLSENKLSRFFIKSYLTDRLNAKARNFINLVIQKTHFFGLNRQDICKIF